MRLAIAGMHAYGKVLAQPVRCKEAETCDLRLYPLNPQRDISVRQGMSDMNELVTPPNTHSLRRDWL